MEQFMEKNIVLKTDYGEWDSEFTMEILEKIYRRVL